MHETFRSAVLWSVALDRTEQSAEIEGIMFTARGGTHSYVVGSPTGYTPWPPSGTVEVNRERFGVRVKYTPVGPRP